MSRLPCSEGDVFALPLRAGGWGRGVVTRMAPKGNVLFGYFFGPRTASADEVGEQDLKPDLAILQMRFGDLGLLNGEWRVVGRIEGWDRREWPMPEFARQDLLRPGQGCIVRYCDDDPALAESETRAEPAANLPHDTLAGYGAIEIRLSKLLAGS